MDRPQIFWRLAGLLLTCLTLASCSLVTPAHVAVASTAAVPAAPTTANVAAAPAPTVTATPRPAMTPTVTPTIVPTTTAVPTATATMTAAPTTTATSTATTLATAAPPAAGSGSIGDPYYPLLGNGGYDVLHYTLDLSPDVAANTLSATAAIEARATRDLGAFNLDFQGFTLHSVMVDSIAAAFQRTRHELTITPSTPIRAGETFTTTLAYAGSPVPIRSQAVPISVGWNRYPGGSYVANEPEGAATWYPVNDHPRDKATYTFRITVPKPYVAAANGVLRNTIDHGATQTYVWETLHPVASYLTTVDIGTFVMRSETGPHRLPIRNFYPPDLAPVATKVFAHTGAMIAYFSKLFGPYPFETYGVVVPNVDWGNALETQTLSTFGRDLVRQAATKGDETTVAHELVHQWFGDSVTVTNWKDVWLNEGFATYGEWLWLEHTKGAARLRSVVSSTYADMAGSDFPPPGNPPPDDLFNASVYMRGALTLEALRLRVGDAVFFRILRTYAERYRDGNASTANFTALAAEVSKHDLTNFFDAWLYSTRLPAIPELHLSTTK